MVETIIWKERFKIKGVQVDNLRGLICIGRMDKVLNAWIKELCKMTKGMDKSIDEGVLQWFGHMERTEKGKIVKRFYVRECTGSCSGVSQWKKM